jgi:hypothetical protein
MRQILRQRQSRSRESRVRIGGEGEQIDLEQLAEASAPDAGLAHAADDGHAHP